MIFAHNIGENFDFSPLVNATKLIKIMLFMIFVHNIGENFDILMLLK